MSLPANLNLEVIGGPTLDGWGADLELKWEVLQITKKGRRHRSSMTLKLGRHAIRQIADQIAQMQQRDRDRIAREVDRLTLEVLSLTHPG